MVGVTDIWEHVMGHTQHAVTVLMFICYLFAGLVGGFRCWNSMEGKYNKALLSAHPALSTKNHIH